MKKQNLLVVLLLLLVAAITHAQRATPETTLENWSSPQGVFDNVFDGSGTSVAITNILAGQTYTVNSAPSTSTLLCTSGIFEL